MFASVSCRTPSRSAGVLRHLRVEPDRSLAELRLDHEPAGLVPRRVDAQREILRGEILHRQIEALRLVADGVVAKHDLSVAQRDAVGRERPAERLGVRDLFGLGGLAGNRSRQEQPVLQPVEPQSEARELDLLDLDRLRHEREPADLRPQPLRLEQRGLRRGPLVDVDGESLERDTAADQREIDVRELDATDQRRVDLRHDHGPQHVRERDAHEQHETEHREQDPVPPRAQRAQHGLAVGGLHPAKDTGIARASRARPGPPSGSDAGCGARPARASARARR